MNSRQAKKPRSEPGPLSRIPALLERLEKRTSDRPIDVSVRIKVIVNEPAPVGWLVLPPEKS